MAPGSASGKHPFYVVCKCGLGCCVCGGRRVGVGVWGLGLLVVLPVCALFVGGGGWVWVKCPCGGFGSHLGCWVFGWCWCSRRVVWLSATVRHCAPCRRGVHRAEGECTVQKGGAPCRRGVHRAEGGGAVQKGGTPASLPYPAVPPPNAMSAFSSETDAAPSKAIVVNRFQSCACDTYRTESPGDSPGTLDPPSWHTPSTPTSAVPSAHLRHSLPPAPARGVRRVGAELAAVGGPAALVVPPALGALQPPVAHDGPAAPLALHAPRVRLQRPPGLRPRGAPRLRAVQLRRGARAHEQLRRGRREVRVPEPPPRRRGAAHGAQVLGVLPQGARADAEQQEGPEAEEGEAAEDAGGRRGVGVAQGVEQDHPQRPDGHEVEPEHEADLKGTTGVQARPPPPAPSTAAGGVMDLALLGVCRGALACRLRCRGLSNAGVCQSVVRSACSVCSVLRRMGGGGGYRNCIDTEAPKTLQCDRGNAL